MRLVMLDSDLAELYGYEVKRLNEQVRRNKERFPDDFMFQLTKEDIEVVKSQFATSREIGFFSGQEGGRRKLPYAFTEQGIYAQYPQLDVKYTNVFHDRFLILDRKIVYHIGASLKDAGKKCFGITLMKDAGSELMKTTSRC